MSEKLKVTDLIGDNFSKAEFTLIAISEESLSKYKACDSR